jgi:hypothetical protein
MAAHVCFRPIITPLSGVHECRRCGGRWLAVEYIDDMFQTSDTEWVLDERVERRPVAPLPVASWLAAAAVVLGIVKVAWWWGPIDGSWLIVGGLAVAAGVRWCWETMNPLLTPYDEDDS